MTSKDTLEHFRERFEQDSAAVKSLIDNHTLEHESPHTGSVAASYFKAADRGALVIEMTEPLLTQRILNGAFYNGTKRSTNADNSTGLEVEPFLDSYEVLRVGRLLLSIMPGLVKHGDYETANFTPNEFRGRCSSAERFYRDALAQVRSGRKRDHEIVSAYHNEKGQALAFRKDNDISSALTLTRLGMGPMILPAGTIVGIDHSSAELTGSFKRGSHVLRSYLVNNEFSLTPCRLSPWAFDNPADRALFGVSGPLEYPKYSRTRANLVANVGIDDFRDAAQTVMELCGVAA